MEPFTYQTVTSRNKQLALNWGAETLKIETPQAQGVVGKLSQFGPVKLSDVQIHCRNSHAAVVVVAMDGEPLSASKRVLVQAATPSQLTGYRAVTLEEPKTVSGKDGKSQTIPAGVRHIQDTGKLPFVIDAVDADITINGPAFAKAIALDLYGQPLPGAQVTLQRTGSTTSLRLPAECYFTILER